jgi:hypothetical protein
MLYLHNPDIVQSEWRGWAIAQAVTCHLPTTVTRVWFQVKSWGICGGQSGTGQVSFKNLRFPCQFSFHQMVHTHLSSGPGTVGQLVADVPPPPPQKTRTEMKTKRWHKHRICISMSPSCDVVDIETTICLSPNTCTFFQRLPWKGPFSQICWGTLFFHSETRGSWFFPNKMMHSLLAATVFKMLQMNSFQFVQ